MLERVEMQVIGGIAGNNYRGYFGIPVIKVWLKEHTIRPNVPITQNSLGHGYIFKLSTCCVILCAAR